MFIGEQIERRKKNGR